jgi:ABC-2 type transport system ATP-binding protein
MIRTTRQTAKDGVNGMDIQVNGISKSFGREKVLDNLSLVAPAGEILGLIGPSGAGKTTLIRLINGSLRPDHGEIRIGGHTVPDRGIQFQIGYMPQEDAVYNDLSGLDNLLFFGRLYQVGTRLPSKAMELLAWLGLEQDARKLAGQYSSGMRKRLSLAIALLHDPPVLLLDEPTVGIDPVLRQLIWDRFNELRRQNKTLLISTHVMDEAQRCQRAALLYQGRLIENDTVENLVGKAPDGRLETLFFRSVPAPKGGEQA